MTTVRSGALRTYMACAAVFAWTAVLVQFVLALQFTAASGQHLLWGVVVYFGYFTVLTNILAATAFTAPLVGPESRLGRLFSRSDVITTITAAIVVVSVDYFLLLRSVWDPSGVQLAVDVSLHYVAPALCVVYWWLAVSRARLGWGDVGKSLVYPLGYIVYLIVRGAVTGHYPYYFVDASKLGHGRALANMAAITGGFLIVAVALVGVTRLSARAPVES
jgi:hypothetical protein